MAKKPTYEELERKFKELEKAVIERKRAEDALRESEELFRTVVETAPSLLQICDAENNNIYVSPNCEEIFGYTQEELRGEPIWWVHEDDMPRAKHLHDRTFREGVGGKNFEYKAVKKNGELLYASSSWEPLRDAEGKFKGIVFQTIDVTKRKRAEEERKQLEAQFQQAQKMESIGTLAGGIAHDFNNVLMGIQGQASLMLLRTDPDHPHFERLIGIEDMVRNGAGLTKQLLGFARGGKYEVKPTDLNELIENTSEMFGRTKKELNIHRRHQKDIWPVEIDRGQIEQVLLNLYVNAGHAMPGGGHLYIETSNVMLDEKDTKPFGGKHGNYVKISVTDTGVGMDELTQQRIFDPFFTTREVGRGTGLGLASAYGIIKNHGGIINVYSKKGAGTTFNIYLTASGKEVTIKEKKLADEILKGTETVLLVDDEDMILDVGKDMLGEAGYKVLLARSGKEAVEVCGKQKDNIDLVIVDMIMPEMGGGEAYDRIKEINPKVKALLASGYSIDGQATEILERGCEGFIQKPFSVKELSEKIREILDKK